MKKEICILLAVISIFSLFFGCSKDDIEMDDNVDDNVFENYSEADNSSSQDTIYIDSGVVDYENVNFEYNGKPLEFDYKFNCSADCEMGLQLFVNGILQQFTVDNQEYSLYKVNCRADTDEIFHISFSPDNGKKGESSSLIFANIYNPEIIELKGDVNTFGNFQKISQPMPWGIKMNVDATQKEFAISNDSNNYDEHKFTEEELNEFIKIKDDGTKINTLDEAMYFDTSKDTEKISKSDEKILTFNLKGNLEGKYRISLYGDFEKISICGSDYIDIDVKKNTQYSIRVPIEEIENCKNVYAVAVALDNSQGLIKSSSYYIE
ncbi:MAG: hypothetical protein LIO62_05025 [Clostridiales bacterium]|nr:hypothetical protein [Clostridiales bacterium]